MTVEKANEVAGVFNRWQYQLPKTTSRWRLQARQAIGRVIESYESTHDLDDLDHVDLRGLVDAAYPFGERRLLPYKMWLLERRLFIDSLATHEVASTPDEIAACDVARDLVELGRIADAVALLEEQAPNRLCRACPACGVGASRQCKEPYDDKYGRAMVGWSRFRDLLVPHVARMEASVAVIKRQQATDDGPLFDGPITKMGEGFIPDDFEDEESSNSRARRDAES